MSGYTYLQNLVEDTNTQKLITAGAVAAGLVVVGALASSSVRRKLSSPSGLVDADALPSEKITLHGAIDSMVEAFVSYQDSILGKENRHHLPLVGSVFFFILFANLLGLVPGMAAATTTVWVNVGVGLVVFLYFNWAGIREHGFINYILHFAGPKWWLAWLIFPLEIFSTALRLLTLNLRLYWNINADHMLLGTFTDLVPYVAPVVFLVLGTFVCCMQAFVFTTLTMVYILLATQHEEGHDEHAPAEGGPAAAH